MKTKTKFKFFRIKDESELDSLAEQGWDIVSVSFDGSDKLVTCKREVPVVEDQRPVVLRVKPSKAVNSLDEGEVQKSVVHMIYKHIDYTGKIDMDTNLRELGLDSLDMVSIVMDIENTLSVIIEDEDMAGMDTVQDIVDTVMNSKPKVIVNNVIV